MVPGVRWRGGLLGFWVRLGGKMRVIWEEFGVLVCSGTKGKEMWIFSEEEGRILGSLWLGERTGEGGGLGNEGCLFSGFELLLFFELLALIGHFGLRVDAAIEG